MSAPMRQVPVDPLAGPRWSAVGELADEHLPSGLRLELRRDATHFGAHTVSALLPAGPPWPRALLRRATTVGLLLLALGCTFPRPDRTLEAPPAPTVTPPLIAPEAQQGPAVCTRDGWCADAPTPQSDPLFALTGLPGGERWAVGERGVVLHGAGAAWSRESWGTAERWVGAWASPSGTVWAVGPQGTRRWANGAWRHEPEVGRSLRGVTGFADDDVWAAGDFGALLHWDGATWSDHSLGARRFHAVFGASPRDVWAVGEAGALAHWDGTTTQASDAPVPATLFCAWGPSATDVWAGGALGTLLHFDGHAWVATSAPTTETVRGLWGSSASDVWAVGSGGLILHFDGAAWTRVASPTGHALSAVWGRSATEVWSVGSAGEVLRFDGVRWTRASALPETRLESVATTREATWAVGAGGVVMRQVAGPWAVVDAGTSADLRAIYSPDGEDLWAAGDGVVLRWNAWARAPMDDADLIVTVSGTGPADVWAAGARLHHFDGVAWKTVPGPAVTWRVLRAVAPDDVWAAGETPAHVGALAHWDGQRWTQVFTASFANVLSVWAADGGGWAVGDGVWRLQGGAWALHHPEPGRRLWSVWGDSLDDVWAVGDRGLVEQWSDGGWATVDAGTGATLLGVWASSPGDVWVVGLGGTVRHYDGAAWQELDAGVGDGVVGVWGSAADDVYVAGTARVAHWDGQALRPVPGPEQVGGALWGPGRDEVYTAGRGVLWRRAPEWKAVPVEGIWAVGALPDGGIPASFVGLSGTSNDLWAASTHWMLHWSGQAWSLVDVPPQTYRGVFALGPSDVWALGELGLSHFDGTHFGPSELPAGVPLAAVWGQGDELWAAGARGLVLHRQAGAWSAEPTGSTERLDAVWGTSARDVWAAGDRGALVHWDGAAWRVVASGTTASLRGLSGRSTTDVVSVGDGTSVLRLDAARAQP